jgi:hypothetical protein
MDFKAHQAVPIYKGLISYLAPNAAVGMIIDATRRYRPFSFRDIFEYQGETNQTLGLNIGKEVEFVVVSDKITLFLPSK